MPAMSLKFEDLELDLRSYQLRRNGSVIKLERIPMELLILLASKGGQLVSREEIIEKLWGKDVFVDSEHGVNTAIRKIRNALKDDPDRPRFIETVVGKGYRFVASVTGPVEEPLPVAVQARPSRINSRIKRLLLIGCYALIVLLAVAYLGI